MIKHIFWGIIVIIIIAMICGTLIFLNLNPWTVKIVIEENISDNLIQIKNEFFEGVEVIENDLIYELKDETVSIINGFIYENNE